MQLGTLRLVHLQHTCECHRSANLALRSVRWILEYTRALGRSTTACGAISERGAGIAMTYMCVAQVRRPGSATVAVFCIDLIATRAACGTVHTLFL